MSWHDLNVGAEYELEDVITILGRRVSTCELDNVDDNVRMNWENKKRKERNLLFTA